MLLECALWPDEAVLIWYLFCRKCHHCIILATLYETEKEQNNQQGTQNQACDTNSDPDHAALCHRGGGTSSTKCGACTEWSLRNHYHSSEQSVLWHHHSQWVPITSMILWRGNTSNSIWSSHKMKPIHYHNHSREHQPMALLLSPWGKTGYSTAMNELTPMPTGSSKV